KPDAADEPEAFCRRVGLVLQHELAALLAAGPGDALSRATALTLWRLPAPPDERTVHVTTTSQRRSRAGLTFHRTADLPRKDIRRVQGLAVTSPARTILDTAPSLDPDTLEAVIAAAVRRNLTTRAELDRRATGRVAQALHTGPRFTRSDAEILLLKLVRAAKLPLPETNVDVAGIQPDAVWREQRVAVEVDGYEFHGDRRSFEEDRERGVRLTAAGYTVVRITWRQLTQQPHTVTAALAVALA
ncbi:MAG TPA: DUF559 domain-containing protein, partial [Solirubrobacteraceae bacterium]|nr:DUF559 domain-containing protein [Solirubrobacteraceae bacterium]